MGSVLPLIAGNVEAQRCNNSTSSTLTPQFSSYRLGSCQQPTHPTPTHQPTTHPSAHPLGIRISPTRCRAQNDYDSLLFLRLYRLVIKTFRSVIILLLIRILITSVRLRLVLGSGGGGLLVAWGVTLLTFAPQFPLVYFSYLSV